MRIALLVERIAPTGGGVEQAAWHVAEALTKAGECVHVLCRESASPPSGVTISQVPASDLWQPWRVTAYSYRVARKIDRADSRFDIVHAFTRTRNPDVYRAGAGRHVDFLRHTHGRFGAAIRGPSPRHWIARRADRQIFSDRTSLIQCPSRLVRDELVHGAGIDPARTVVIPNGVDPERFHPRCDALSRALRARYAAPGDTVWLFAGSGAKRKGLGVAIRALAEMSSTKTVLWVAGRDAPDRWLRAARRLGVASRVRFLGLRGDMPDVYRAADGMLLPTRYDPFANASLEAAACGLPVISSLRNGAMEVIHDGGIAVKDPGSIVEVASALDRLNDRNTRLEMAERALENAGRNDWTSHTERLRDVYTQVILRRRALPSSAAL